ncbi:MAG: AAA domain-containing protein [Runella sp.]
MNLTTPILKTYLRRLTNLSTRNRSLLLTSLPIEQYLDWKSLDFLTNRSAYEVLAEVIAQKKSITLCQRLDSRFEKVNEISKRLAKIARTESFIKEERGSEDLYVGYPFVRGKFADGTPVHAPLIFFPVTLYLNSDSNEWQLRRRPEAASLNRSFLLAYSHFNQIRVGDEWLETNLDDLSRDALVFRTELYELLKNSPITLHFNQDIFQNQLQYFDSVSKSDLDLLERNGQLKLYPEAVLGIFPQAGSYLAPDYEALIEKAEGRRQEVEDTRQEAGDRRQEIHHTSYIIHHIPIKEDQTLTALPQDASQELALKRIKQGTSMVVQGPPGTGKSQLIANLITDFTAKGKRVLLVCQKRVALDVVYNRLAEVGMSAFVALVHDFKNDRAALYRQLESQIEQVEGYQSQNRQLNAIMLEREFRQVSRQIEQISAELETFRSALFDDSDCGLSPKELYLTCCLQEPYISLPNFKNFRFDHHTESLKQKLHQFQQYRQYLPHTHPWGQRVSFAHFNFSQIGQIRGTLLDILDWAENCKIRLASLAGFEQMTFTELPPKETFEAFGEESSILQDKVNWELFQQFLKGFWDKKRLSQLQKIETKIGQLHREGLLGTEAKTVELMTLKVRLESLIEARKNPFKWLFYGDKAVFKSIAQRYGLGLRLGDLYQLLALLERRIEWQRQVEKLTSLTSCSFQNENFQETQHQVANFFVNFKKVNDFYQKWQLQQPSLIALANSSATMEALTQQVKSLLELASQTQAKYQHWKKWLTESQILEAQKAEKNRLLITSLEKDFDLLVEMDRLLESLSPSEYELLQMLSQQNTGDIVALFDNSLRLEWLAYLEEKQPLLRMVSSLKISQLEDELQKSIARKEALSREILAIQLREQTYRELEYNRLQNIVTYRDLRHQVTKKRKIWPLRRLLEHHADEVFRLVPCWLASPETVSAIFPLEEGIFDLVVFDEASQCYAEYGIPAMYRAKQMVVVGDSQQLQPYDLYRLRYDAENPDELPELEVESLLDLAKQTLPETTLQGHYRSRSLELIDFSNRYFYRNKLQLLPHYDDINQARSAITYHKLDGVWENNRNLTEAQKVIELLKDFGQYQTQKTVGVVTFNFPQQHLIEELLGELPRPLFIKNIENVQGDECDILVLSVGYAPDARSRIRLQFGSLNVQGGQNRLNVAVTRARERVELVTSLWPWQLDVENTTHDGPKLLKAYLQYALEVSEGKYRPQPTVETHYRNEWSLKKKLQKVENNGQNLTETLPFADLTVLKNNRYQSLLLTDDELYQQALSAKDAHAYQLVHLKNKGWTYKRCWSRNFWKSGEIK